MPLAASRRISANYNISTLSVTPNSHLTLTVTVNHTAFRNPDRKCDETKTAIWQRYCLGRYSYPGVFFNFGISEFIQPRVANFVHLFTIEKLPL